MPGGTSTSVRLAELVATLSLAADLGLGQPMQHCLQQTVIAVRLADRVGPSESGVGATTYTTGSAAPVPRASLRGSSGAAGSTRARSTTRRSIWSRWG